MNTCNRGVELSPSDDVTRLTPRKDGEQHAWGFVRSRSPDAERLSEPLISV